MLKICTISKKVQGKLALFHWRNHSDFTVLYTFYTHLFLLQSCPFHDLFFYSTNNIMKSKWLSGTYFRCIIVYGFWDNFFYLIGQKIQLTKSWGCHPYSKYHLPVENHQKQPFGEAYLGLFQTSVMEFSCKNSKRLLALNNLHKKASSQSFDWVLNAHLFPFQKR